VEEYDDNTITKELD